MRLLYVWDNTLVGDATATTALVDFAAARAFNTVAIECSPVGYLLPGAAAKFTAFVETLHTAGLDVLALNGYPWFTVPASAAVPGQPDSHAGGWALYANVTASSVPFDGILDDSEPYATAYDDGGPHNWFRENLPDSAQSYVDWLHGLRSATTGLPLYSTIPYWYDEDDALALALDGESQPHPLNWYASRIVDAVNVLDYRDHARGPGGLVQHVRGELETGPLILGVETCEIEADAGTFFEEGRAYMESQLTQVLLAVDGAPALRGFSIHDYGCASTMAP